VLGSIEVYAVMLKTFMFESLCCGYSWLEKPTIVGVVSGCGLTFWQDYKLYHRQSPIVKQTQSLVCTFKFLH